MPNMKQLQKIKKKWYKNNIDKDFDIEYDPDTQPRVNPQNA
jgi:hypothetical protein